MTTNLRALVPAGDLPIEGLAQHFVKSGFFKNSTDLSKAIVNIMYGQEVGIGPVMAMMSIHVIDGKPTLSANLMATMVKRSQRYDYRIREHTAKLCRLEFFEGGQSLGMSEFTIEEAQQAGLTTKQVWKQYQKAMLFSRAVSQGVRWHCPDITGGAPAYTPEELGVEVNEDGEVIETKARVIDHPSLSSATDNHPLMGDVEPDDEEATPDLPHPRAVFIGTQEDVGADGLIVRRDYYSIDDVIFRAAARPNGSPVWIADTCKQHGKEFVAVPVPADSKHTPAWLHKDGSQTCPRTAENATDVAPGDDL